MAETNAVYAEPRTPPAADGGAAKRTDTIDSVRTGHLLVVIVSCALLGTGVFQTTTDSERALQDLNGITRLVAAWKEQPEWFTKRLDARFGQDTVHANFITSRTHTRIELRGRRWALVPSDGEQRTLLDADGGARMTHITTLIAFRRAWDAIARPTTIRFLDRPSDSVMTQYSSSSIHAGITLRPTWEGLAPSPDLPVSPETVAQFAASGLEVTDSSALSPLMLTLRPTHSMNATIGVPNAAWDTTDNEARASLSLRWPATAHDQIVTLQSVVIDSSPLRWSAGEFANTFRELHAATSLYSDLDFGRIEAILANDARRSGERVDLGPIKVSATVSRDWGVWILLAVYSFFLVHLSAFATEIENGKTAKLSAWMGLYQSRLSQLVVGASAVALPVFAGGLAVATRLGQRRDVLSLVAVAGGILLLVAAVSVGGLLTSLWKKRFD